MEEPNSLWPYPYSPKLRAEVCLRGGVKKQEGQSTLCPGVRPGLPCSETASAGRWRRESHRKGGGAWALCLGPQPRRSAALPLLSLFVVNCDSVQSMPTITFIISGSHFPLPPSAYVFNIRIHPRVPGLCVWMGPRLVCVPAHIWVAMGNHQGQG